MSKFGYKSNLRGFSLRQGSNSHSEELIRDAGYSQALFKNTPRFKISLVVEKLLKFNILLVIRAPMVLSEGKILTINRVSQNKKKIKNYEI